MAYDNTNTGALFKNDRKETANHPDYSGSVNVNGVEYWLSAWIKPTKADASKRFMSLSVKPKEAAKAAPPQRSAAPQRPYAADRDDGSDIPF